MNNDKYIIKIIVPFLNAIIAGKEPPAFYRGWARSIVEWKDAEPEALK